MLFKFVFPRRGNGVVNQGASAEIVARCPDDSPDLSLLSREIQQAMKIITLFFMVGLPLAVAGQRPRIAFETKSHDFGKIASERGIVSHVFAFTNRGNVPLLVIDVESSCGCTVPVWSDRPVLPGESGHVTVRMNPATLSGKFNKRITVYSSGETVTHLKISGEVIAAPVNVDADFPFLIGSLRVDVDSVLLDDGQRSRVIQLYNAGKKNIAITSISKPGEIVVDYTPLIILPGSRGSLVLLHVPREEIGTGARHERVLVRTSEGATGTIHVTIR
jgi:hypothetical protein